MFAYDYNVVQHNSIENASKTGKGKKSTSTVDAILPIRSEFTHVAALNLSSALDISVQVIGRASTSPQHHLSEVMSTPRRLLNANGAYPFRFNLIIPDPRPEDMGRGDSKEVSRLSKDSMHQMVSNVK